MHYNRGRATVGGAVQREPGTAVTVGILANPASGRDIRRLTTGASVFDNAEKGAMIARLTTGLGAAGVDRVLVMPAGDGVSESLRRNLRGRTGQALPDLETLPQPVHGDVRDTIDAVALMRAAGVAAIVVLGGDGTHRAVATVCGDVPLCALSTGTNNAFPELREATVAGLATGLYAAGAVGGEGLLRREKRLDVYVGGRYVAPALVDVARSRDRWVGARALWRPEDVTDVVVAFASPAAVGLSALAGQLDPVPRDGPDGLAIRLAPPDDAPIVVTAALAPGLVTRLGVADVRRVRAGEQVPLDPGPCCLALDGERELELGDGQAAAVALGTGPLVLDVDAVLAAAARESALTLHREGAAR